MPDGKREYANKYLPIIVNFEVMRNQSTKITSLLVFLLLGCTVLTAQADRQLKVKFDPPSAVKDMRFPSSVKDSVQMQRIIRDSKTELQSGGYLLADIELTYQDSLRLELMIIPGPRYELALLGAGNLPEIIQSKVGYREKFFHSTPFNYREIERLFRRIVGYGENNGYPFASVHMDSVRIENGRFYGVINYVPGPLITYDSLHVTGDLRIKPGFLSMYLQIKPGTVYSQRKSDRIEDRLKSLSYVALNSRVATSFQNAMSTHYLDLSYRNVNQIDGIIGFLPNEREGNKLLVTGEFNLSLNNLFQSGKSVRLEWRSLRPESQYLNARYEHPFLLGTPIGLNFAFDLLKEDSTFLNRNFRIEVDYIPGTFSKLRFFTEFRNSGILSSELAAEPMGSLELADFDLTAYGLGYTLNTSDNPIFPTSGLLLETEAFLGNKNIKRNSQIDISFYDSLDLSSIQYYITLMVQKFLQTGKRSVLALRGNAGKVDNKQLFLNDLFRLGGLKSLRGFNERYFYAAEYAVFSAEWRYLMDRNSYFFLFYDQGFLNYDLEEIRYKDEPSGIGAGISLSSKAGIFNLVYALGRTRDQPFTFNLSKIHFGYISRF